MANLQPIKENIKAVRYNTKTLRKDLKAQARALMDIKGTDWKVREKEILKLAGMALEHAVEDREFGEAFQREMARAMAEQILDLRSQIVKASCAAVVVLAEELDTHFDTTFEQFLLPALIKQLPVKAQPIRDSAHECISAVLAHHTNPKLFRPLFNASTEKEKIIRGRVAEYLAYICENWEQSALQKNLGVLLSNLKPMLQDGSEVVREYSRQCVVTLAPDFPRGVTELLTTVDPKVVRMMEPDLPEEVMQGLQEMGPRHSGGAAALPVPQRQNVRRSTGSYAAPQVDKTRLSGGPARVASTPHYDDQDPNSSRRRTGGTARSMGSTGARRQPAGRQRSTTESGVGMRKVQSQQPQGRAAAMASLGNVEDGGMQRVNSDPADLLNRLQNLRSEVLRISAARS